MSLMFDFRRTRILPNKIPDSLTHLGPAQGRRIRISRYLNASIYVQHV
jgi:hypothetical protein